MATDDLEFRRHLRDAVQRNIPPLERSSVFVSIFSRSYEEDAVAVLQLGLAVLMNKPICLLVKRGDVVPAALEKVANAIEFYDADDAMSLKAATMRLLDQVVLDPSIPQRGL